MTRAALGVGQMDSRCPRSGLCGFPCAATLPSRALFILTDGWCSWCEYATTDFSTDSRCDSGTFLCVTVLESVLGTFGWGPSECILVGHRSRSGLAGAWGSRVHGRCGHHGEGGQSGTGSGRPGGAGAEPSGRQRCLDQGQGGEGRGSEQRPGRRGTPIGGPHEWVPVA